VKLRKANLLRGFDRLTFVQKMLSAVQELHKSNLIPSFDAKTVFFSKSMSPVITGVERFLVIRAQLSNKYLTGIRESVLDVLKVLVTPQKNESAQENLCSSLMKDLIDFMEDDKVLDQNIFNHPFFWRPFKMVMFIMDLEKLIRNKKIQIPSCIDTEVIQHKNTKFKKYCPIAEVDDKTHEATMTILTSTRNYVS
jgi:hypothetical protein